MGTAQGYDLPKLPLALFLILSPQQEVPTVQDPAEPSILRRGVGWGSALEHWLPRGIKG